jgi:subtilase family serine protease
MRSNLVVAGIALLMLMGQFAGLASALDEGAAAGRAGPDIAVVAGSYGIIPNPPRVQDTLTVNVTVINQGDTAAGAFTVAFYMNNTGTKLNPSNTVRINSLGVGATANVTCAWNTQTTEFFAYITGVNYTIIVMVDTLGEIAEGNEANNRFDYNQTLGPERLPDLILTSCSAEPASLIRGGTVTINATITNTGEAAGKFFKVYCFADNINQAISSVDVANLNIAEVKSVTMNWDTTDYAPGLHSVLVIVNPDFYFTKIMEPDWSNNNGTKQVTIVAPPLNLYVGSIVLAPSEPHRGDNLVINCTVKNNATGSAENISTIISIDIEELNKRTLTLASQESVSLGAEVDTSVYGEGNHNITVSVAGVVKTKMFTLLTFRKADLVPIEVTVTPQSARVGQVLDVSFKVHNAGDATAGASKVSLLADYITAPVCATQLSALDPDALVTVNMSWNTAGSVGGAHRLRIFVDSGYAVLEGNETNNNYVINLDLEGALDLKMENVTLRPAAPKSGEKVQFSATVKNLGSLPSNSSNVTLSIGGSPVDSKLITFVDPGLSRDASLNWQTVGLPAGTYDYSVSVVTLGNYTDANPANDAVTGTVELLPPTPAPDLKVSDITVVTASPRSGDNLTLLVKVDNIGNVDAGTSTLMINLEKGTAMLKFTDSAVQVPALTAGSSTTVNVTRPTTAFKAGNYRIIATADYSAALAELNETNNVFPSSSHWPSPLKRRRPLPWKRWKWRASRRPAAR